MRHGYRRVGGFHHGTQVRLGDSVQEPGKRQSLHSGREAPRDEGPFVKPVRHRREFVVAAFFHHLLIVHIYPCRFYRHVLFVHLRHITGFTVAYVQQKLVLLVALLPVHLVTHLLRQSVLAPPGRSLERCVLKFYVVGHHPAPCVLYDAALRQRQRVEACHIYQVIFFHQYTRPVHAAGLIVREAGFIEVALVQRVVDLIRYIVKEVRHFLIVQEPLVF